MSLFKDCLTYHVLGQKIEVISERLDRCLNTVAEVDGAYHYLGDEQPNIGAAILTWQRLHDRELTAEELRQVLVDNRIISQAI